MRFSGVTLVLPCHLTIEAGLCGSDDRKLHSADGLARLGRRKHVGPVSAGQASTGDSETPVTAWHLSQIDRLLSDDSVGKGCAVPFRRSIGLGHVISFRNLRKDHYVISHVIFPAGLGLGLGLVGVRVGVGWGLGLGSDAICVKPDRMRGIDECILSRVQFWWPWSGCNNRGRLHLLPEW